MVIDDRGTILGMVFLSGSYRWKATTVDGKEYKGTTRFNKGVPTCVWDQAAPIDNPELMLSIELAVEKMALEIKDGPEPKRSKVDKIRNALGLYHTCNKCGYKYKHPVQWVANFRTGFHKNPDTGMPCYWMLFKDGSQTHDYPGE